MIMTRDPRTFYFNFHWPKDDDKTLKHKIGYILKSKESLPENKTKNKIQQILLKYKHGNDIHEHEKQPNE